MNETTITRSVTDPAGIEHTTEFEPVRARTDGDGRVTLTVAPEATPAEVAAAAYRAGWDAGARNGWEQGYGAGVRATVEAAAEVTLEATRQVAAGGPEAAALLLPRSKVFVKDAAGRVTGLREFVE